MPGVQLAHCTAFDLGSQLGILFLSFFDAQELSFASNGRVLTNLEVTGWLDAEFALIDVGETQLVLCFQPVHDGFIHFVECGDRFEHVALVFLR